MISFQTKSQSFENVIQLLRINSGPHSIALGPLREEVFEARADLLTESDEHVVSWQFVKRLF